LAGTMRADIERLESGEATLGRLEQETAAARAAYEAAADHLSALRAEAGARLDAAVAGELAPLRLEKARFRTALARETDGPGAEHGRDRVRFEVSTNPGRPFGPLSDVASGGEFARFVLALKVVLGAREGPRTFIFDEVDQGVGGAVADAVGERLARLAQGPGQLFVVTHSPQVAARGTHHLRVEKTGPAANDEQGAAETALTTRVVALDAAARLDEIARMLSGAEITEEARAAAARLLGSGRPPPPRRKRTGTG
ncbi:MAG: DNA repair protein RecN, partial [Alphaproteobacteria bacterium]|nr:DNA repair protein RecN [Alphaproteobacteria bacterium]